MRTTSFGRSAMPVNEHGLPHPTVITESGRAVTAHHTVLVSNIIGVERNEFTTPTVPPEQTRPVRSKHVGYLERNARAENRRSLREWLHDSQIDLHDIHTGYSRRDFSICKQRAWAEAALSEHLPRNSAPARPKQPCTPSDHRRAARTYGG